jgi:MOSC domain-containing protein YiiM
MARCGARSRSPRDGLRAELEGKRGMLARVVESGEVAVGDEVTLL